VIENDLLTRGRMKEKDIIGKALGIHKNKFCFKEKKEEMKSQSGICATCVSIPRSHKGEARG
jgi:hypothetical protein